MAGVIWYQGESDCSGSPEKVQYQTLLTGLFQSWRAALGNKTLPFAVVEVANYGPVQAKPVKIDDYDAATIRDAQLKAVQADPNAALVDTIDIGDASTIYPPNKWDVGARLTLAVSGHTHGQNGNDVQGPLFTPAVVENGSIRVSFAQVTSGLMVGQKVGRAPTTPVPNGVVTGFAVADSACKWVAATAVIDANTLVVSAPSVANPVAVRYGWAANPSCNLYNGVGLPAAPFRSDTQPSTP